VSDRSEELRRQRELVREHLAWLDREIAAAEGSTLPQERAPLSPPRIVPPSYSSPAQPEPADAEAILSEFRQDTTSITSDTRRGCILYVVAALGVLALIVTAMFFYIRSHGGR
jgi:hypothetical protein